MPAAPIRHDLITMLDAEKILLSASPDKPVVPVWVSSDPAQVSVEPAADGLTCLCNNLTETAAADISLTAPGFTTEIQPLAFAPPIPGRLNLSAGMPMPD